MAAAVSFDPRAPPPPPKPPSRKRLIQAEADIVFFFQERESSLGLTGFDPTAPHTLHVERELLPSSWRVANHARRTGLARRAAIVERSLAKMGGCPGGGEPGPSFREIAKAIYQPFPCPIPLREFYEVPHARLSMEAEEFLRRERELLGLDSVPEPRIYVPSVVGAAVLTRPWVEAWARATSSPGYRGELPIAWAADLAVTKYDKRNRAIPPPRWPHEAREIALGWRHELLVSYAEASAPEYIQATREREATRALKDAAYRASLRGVDMPTLLKTPDDED